MKFRFPAFLCSFNHKREII